MRIGKHVPGSQNSYYLNSLNLNPSQNKHAFSPRSRRDIEETRIANVNPESVLTDGTSASLGFADFTRESKRVLPDPGKEPTPKRQKTPKAKEALGRRSLLQLKCKLESSVNSHI